MEGEIRPLHLLPYKTSYLNTNLLRYFPLLAEPKSNTLFSTIHQFITLNYWRLTLHFARPSFPIPAAAIQLLDEEMVKQLPPMESLFERMRECEWTNFQGRNFLPNRALSEVLNQEAFLHALSEFPDCPAKDSIIHDRSKSYVRIFAILNDIAMAKEIFDFVVSGVDDSDLPMPRPTPKNQGLLMPWGAVTAGWSPLQLREFYDRQFRVMVPSFQYTNKGAYSVDNRIREDPSSFHPDIILPFIYIEPLEESGGFSDVFRVRLHPDYLHVNSGENEVSFFTVFNFFLDVKIFFSRLEANSVFS